MLKSIGDIPMSEEQQILLINGGILKCEDMHDGSCLLNALLRFVKIWNNSYKYYIPIHLIPLLLFQRRKLRQNPGKTLKQFFLEFCGSVFFVAGYVSACRYFFCKLKAMEFNNRISLSLSGFFSGIFLFVEKLNRRAEITIFLAPRVLETVWNMLQKRNFVMKIDYWEYFVFGIAMGIINYYYIVKFLNFLIVFNFKQTIQIFYLNIQLFTLSIMQNIILLLIQPNHIKYSYLQVFKKIWN